MNHLSLFSGIGGLDLAAEQAGFETVGQCEYADFQYNILKKHWPNVPKWRDIKSLTGESFYEKTGLRTVDLISGGFPCQPFSTLGKRNGRNDNRYLWAEMFRIIKEIRPAWVVGENVVGIVSMELDQILFDLEGENYKTRAFIIPACSQNAPHRRDRVAIVANLQGENGIYVATQKRSRSNEMEEYRRCTWWDSEPRICRVVDGVPTRLDRHRLEALGNAVVPQQFYPIFYAIKKSYEK